MHIDTTWKFKEMISFRDETAQEIGFELLIQTNREGVEEGVTPFSMGASEYTRIMKTIALRAGLDKHGFDAEIGGSRRDARQVPESQASKLRILLSQGSIPPGR
jgi:sulfate adenylyltransferase subunit 2